MIQALQEAEIQVRFIPAYRLQGQPDQEGRPEEYRELA
jgi:hypothetical protein